MQRIAVTLVCLAVAGSACFGAGTTAVESLKLGAGARAAGMGDAFVGVASDASAVYWNPAGLNRIGSMCGSVMTASLAAGISYNWLSFVCPMKDIGTFGGGVQMVSYGAMKEIDETGWETGNTFSPSDMVLTASYGRILKSMDMPVGVSLKMISSKITKSASAIAIDAGGMYRLKEQKITLGFAIQNLGTGVKYVGESSPLPMNIKVGGAYPVNDNWTAAADLNLPSAALALGTEYNYKLQNGMTVAGRAGFNTGTSALSLGAGLVYEKYTADLAFAMQGDLGTPIRLSVGMKF